MSSSRRFGDDSSDGDDTFGVSSGGSDGDITGWSSLERRTDASLGRSSRWAWALMRCLAGGSTSPDWARWQHPTRWNCRRTPGESELIHRCTTINNKQTKKKNSPIVNLIMTWQERIYLHILCFFRVLSWNVCRICWMIPITKISSENGLPDTSVLKFLWSEY